MGRRRLRAGLAAVLTAAVLLTGAAPALAEDPRPTADLAAPTPTAPLPGGPPQGSGPGGVTVGGDELDTRGTVVTDGAPPLPDGLTAAGWLVADATSGVVLAARDPHGRYYPASTLKTLTLLTLVPLLDPAMVVEGTVEDENMEGSRVGMVAGGHYPVSLLFEALVMQSGNDAANALARAAGGVDVTVRAMNETAAALGAFDTVAGSPSGLDVAGQTSSPYDLALVFRRLVADPRTAAILQTPIAQMPPVLGRSEGYEIQNENPLLTRYPGDLGGKTGFTDAARHTFVTAAERDGRRLVVSVMNTENVPLRAADQAALLLDWGFAVPAGSPGVGVLVDSAADVSPPTTAPPPTTPSAVRAVPAPGTAAAGEPAGESPLLALGLGAAAVAVVLAALVGRRRAVRRVPGGEPPVSGRPAAPSSPGGPEPPGPTPGPGAGSPSRRR
ncbi:D-alanyl-D-alanine carboxypeptidase family protein [Geodermatophilus sabuli]|uniref:D-alanyl-D-alanine carboxypeptidase (Penicillin-binding protein 5/6) n=1 Tax=Geodermatophilus sabuli TaxID=1564158 RepID=A0A285ECI3_9ACTN|nr:serine hydrolase [Geodermatophilus sabuli]MBB3084831.1 D-alanyl-D-alanine carboxypeptidase (penicillin-binding protein 5/6) [Geodermatophilus sabuli]SNX95761.1 D-alanyl-D-alanine carboxypeptidase (penicillin-binding protein 5/6) [Geodermatophilus sabuli]